MILERIKELCKEKNISIAGLEKEIGVGNGVIRNWDKSSPRVDTIKKVAEFLGVTVEKLISD